MVGSLKGSANWLALQPKTCPHERTVGPEAGRAGRGRHAAWAVGIKTCAMPCSLTATRPESSIRTSPYPTFPSTVGGRADRPARSAGAGSHSRSSRARHALSTQAPGAGAGKPGTADEERVPVKSSGVLRSGASVSERYGFIDAEYASGRFAPGITQMCAWLGVSRSGFYEWRSRPESATARRQQRLGRLITAIFEDSDGTYGYRRVAAQLARQGTVAGPELVRQLMRRLGLVACQPRPWRPSTTRKGRPGRSRTWCSGTSPRKSRGRRWSAILLISPRGRILLNG